MKILQGYNEVMQNPHSCPAWLTEGVTYLLPKSEDNKHPQNYRPTTCLPTMYKILTSIIADTTYQQNNLLPAEQNGCRRGSYGCKDQLLINNFFIEEAKSRKKYLSMAWIDYRKAFDNVPHSWIRKTLEMYSVPHYHKVQSREYEILENNHAIQPFQWINLVQEDRNQMWHFSRRLFITSAFLHCPRCPSLVAQQ